MSAAPVSGAGARLLAIALFFGLPALLAALIVLDLLQMAEDRLAFAEKTMQVAALTRRLNAPSADGKPLDLSPIHVPGASRTLASANLQQHLVDAVADSSGRLIETLSVEPDASEGQEQADALRLKATLDIDNRGLLHLLYSLEAGLPLLEIETLSVRRLTEATPQGEPETLRVDMTVRGSWRKGAS